jgi:hypothetical protein
MAVVRARSSPPYGLFLAMTFAVIATAAAVIFYFLWSKSVEEHDTAVAEVKSLRSENDKKILNVLTPTISENSTAVSQLNSQITKLNDALDAAKKALDVEKTRVRNAEEVRDSHKAEVDVQRAQVSSAKVAETSARTNLDDVSKTLREETAKFNESIASVGADRDQRLKEAQEALNKAIDDAERARRDLLQKLEDSQSQIVKLAADVLDLRQRIQNLRGKSDVNVGEPDGRVVRVNGAAGEVYINLGKKDRLSPGMPFTCYDPRTGVRFGSDDAAAGNGSIEVISVGEDTSICRVTRTSKDRTIQADDLISNIVYHNDRTRKFRFTVFGDFDLDGDGVVTAAERDRLIVLIKRWGGEVDDDVTSQTDYLVLGAKPKAPLIQESEPAATEPAATEAAATETASAEPAATSPGISIVGSVGESRTKDQARYEDLDIAARRLAIPVLNANRFLAMVGYYNTTVVRY